MSIMTKLVLTEDITPCKIVLHYFAEYDMEDIDYVLLSHTSFPFSSLEWIADEIYEYYLKSKG